MPPRCPHRHVEIIEVGSEIIGHTFVDGQYEESEHEPGLFHATVRVVCFDCGGLWRYSRYKRTPQWVERLLCQIDDRALRGESESVLNRVVRDMRVTRRQLRPPEAAGG